MMTLTRRKLYKGGGASYAAPGLRASIYITRQMFSGEPPESISFDAPNVATPSDKDNARAEKKAAREAAKAERLAAKEQKKADREAAKTAKAQEKADKKAAREAKRASHAPATEDAAAAL